MGALDTIPLQPGYYIEHITPQVLGPLPYRCASELNFRDFMQFVGNQSPQQLVDKSVQAENWLGIGRDTEVYAIPGTYRYVLRTCRDEGDADYGTHNPFAVRSDDSYVPREVLSPEVNFGQVVAEIGLGFGRAQIARRVWGQPFMFSGHVKFSRDHFSLICDFNTANVRLAANLPQQAYDCLAAQIALVADCGFSWEPDQQNLMLTPSIRGFSLVDVNTQSFRGQMQGGKRLSSLIGPFVQTFPGIDDEESKPFRQQILCKAVKAAIQSEFSFLERGRKVSLSLLGFISIGLRMCGLREWFLVHLQECERTGQISKGTYKNWQRLFKLFA